MSTERQPSGSRRRILAAAATGLLGASFLFLQADAAELTMTTAVGLGEGFSGDGAPAVDAGLEGPRMVAFDGQGGYYIADAYNHVIRHVDAAGIISTYAGTPRTPGFRDGPAAQAVFDTPHGVDVMPDGDVIVGDPVNDRVRRIDAETRMVTTIAGNGLSGYSGDGGPATSARLSDSKIALRGPDNGIYIVDMGNDVIRRVDPATGNIETWAGKKGVTAGPDGVDARQGGFSPRNIAWDIDNDLIVADRDGNKIMEIDWETRIITTIAGNGTVGDGGDGGDAMKAQFRSPRGLGVDWKGNIYVADSENNRIRRIDRQTNIVTTVAGSPTSAGGRKDGTMDIALLSNPRHVIFDDAGTMFITDTGNSRIRTIGNFMEPRPVTTTTTTTAPPAGPGPGPGSDPGPGPGSTPPPTTQPGVVRSGYWMLGADGAVYAFGDAAGHGDGGTGAVDIEPTPTGNGYWVVDGTGRVGAHGDAIAFGSVERARLAAGETVTSLSATPSGRGYWVFTNRGRVVTVGDATHYGDMSGQRLNGPVLDSIPTSTGRGYYMVGSDGGIFAFGDARFFGSMGGKPLNAPVQSLVPSAGGAGYWLVASDGGVFAFGESPFRGSMGGKPLNKPITGMVPYGDGYLMVGEDGGIFNFSNRTFAGSLGDRPPARPIVSVAVLD